MRDHRKLRVFALAHQLAIDIYKVTVEFPFRERYGIVSQLRRAAVSIPSNIVEGSARDSLIEYIRFLEVAYGSAIELEYQLQLSRELELVGEQRLASVASAAATTSRALNRLVRALRERARTRSGSPRPEA